MKRTPLKRKTPLRRTTFGKKTTAVKHTAAFFERKKERGREAYRRRKLKAELLLECPVNEAGQPLCPKCLSRPDFRGLQLVHKIPLSGGGKTTRENCVIRCAPCHFGHGEPWSHRTEGKRRTLDIGRVEALQSKDKIQ